MSLSKLDGVTLVTGAGSGIGREIAYAFAEAGMTGVVFADINLSNAQAAVEASKSFISNPAYRALAVAVNVEDLQSVQDMVKTTFSEYGRIDYLVNSAGIDTKEYTGIASSSVDDYDRVMNTNSRGMFYTIREVAPIMKKQESRIVKGRNGERDVGRGSIVNVNSALSYVAVPGKIGYIASKHAALGITKSAAIEYGKDGTRVNALCPSWAQTAMYTDELVKAPQTEDFIKAATGTGRPALPEEVAGAAIFLSGSSASYITGIGLIIDGGATLTAHLG